MLFGRSVIHWIILVFVFVCVFILARWAIPLLFGAVGFPVPEQIATILALLIALGCFWGGYGYRGRTVVP